MRDDGSEEHAEDPDELQAGLERRDARFVWRLLSLLAIAVLASVWLAGWLTRAEIGSCAARGFSDVAAPATTDRAPAAPGP